MAGHRSQTDSAPDTPVRHKSFPHLGTLTGWGRRPVRARWEQQSSLSINASTRSALYRGGNC